MKEYDVVFVGGGIIGLSIARELSMRYKELYPRHEMRIGVLEKEYELAQHASGRNSGVIHSGINLKPGSLKAELCVKGSRKLRWYCHLNGVPMEEVGTLVVATEYEEIKTLEELERRGNENGVPGVEIISRDELKRREPYAEGIAALYSPTGAIVDPKRLVSSIAGDAERNGVELLKGYKLTGVKDGTAITNRGEMKYDRLINCAGVYAHNIARMTGVGEEYTIFPFIGKYFEVIPEASHMINSMLYPAPDLTFPFLGIHYTATTDGGVLVGPNASLALGRESYGSEINFDELYDVISDRRFSRFLWDRRIAAHAFRELLTSRVKPLFVKEAKKLIPKISSDYLVGGTAGIRAQLVDKRGRLVKDFVIKHGEDSTHILNAVSPGLTSSLASAEHVVNELFERGILV